jgi:uncharacterized protein (DUF2062 family)
MRAYIKKIVDRLVVTQSSAKQLALSFCLGNFIAWTPTIPLQTPIVMALAPLLGLNMSVAISALYLINNPLTMIFFYIADYKCGSFIVSMLPTHFKLSNPPFIEHFIQYIAKFIDFKKYLGIDTICFWCLLVGGIVLPCLTTLIAYPVAKRLFTRLLKEKKQNSTN